MSGSGNRINYLLRPAKAIERRMMAQVFSRLLIFSPLEHYQYVGMGSWYFADFSLFHYRCGFGSMVSIEASRKLKEQGRCEYNVPVGSIELYFETTTAALPRLNWLKPSVVWLDYDGKVDRSALGDIYYLASTLNSGSLLAVSANFELSTVKTGVDLDRFLTEQVGRLKIPASASITGDLTQQQYRLIIRDILTAEVELALADRNVGLASEQQTRLVQVFYYAYSDGAEMLTLGWLLLSDADMKKYPECHFTLLGHAFSGAQPFLIRIPLLTPAEMRALSRVNDVDTFETAASIPVPAVERRKFTKVQRYWPSFNTGELM